MNAEMTATATVATLETLTIAELTLADGSLREVGYYDLPREARNVGAVQNGIYRVNEQVRKYNAGIARDGNRLCGTRLVESALVDLGSWVSHAIVSHLRDLEHRKGDEERAVAAKATRAALA